MSGGIEHSNITDPNIHEPKGASSAGVGSVYIADGLGSGDWLKVYYSLTYVIEDASPAGPTSYWLVVPYSALLVRAVGVVNNTFSMNQTISFSIGGIPITDGVINLVAAGSVAGNIYNCTPSALNSISGGSVLEIINTGGSASPFSVALTLSFIPIA